MVVQTKFGGRFPLISLLILGLVLRVGVFALIYDQPLLTDPRAYRSAAIRLLSGDDFEPYYPPGTSLFLMPFYKLLGTDLLISRGAFLLAWLVLALSLYASLKSFVSAQAGILGLTAFTVFPDWIYLSVEPLSQLLAGTCLLIAVSLALAIKRRAWNGRYQNWLCGLVGLVLGFGTLVRPGILPVTIVVVVYAYLSTRSLIKPLIIAGLCLFVVSAWIVRVWDMTGRAIFVNTANSYNFFMGNNEYTPLYRTWFIAFSNDRPDGYLELLRQIRSQPQAEWEQRYRAEAINHIVERPALFGIRTVNRIRAYWGFDVLAVQNLNRGYGLPLLVAALAALGNVAMWLLLAGLALVYLLTPIRGYLDSQDNVFILAVIGVYSVSVWLTFSHPTYHAPVAPLIGVFASVAGHHILTHLKNASVANVRRYLRRHRALTVSWVLLLAVQIEWGLVVVLAEYLNAGYGTW